MIPAIAVCVLNAGSWVIRSLRSERDSIGEKNANYIVTAWLIAAVAMMFVRAALQEYCK